LEVLVRITPDWPEACSSSGEIADLGFHRTHFAPPEWLISNSRQVWAQKSPFYQPINAI